MTRAMKLACLAALLALAACGGKAVDPDSIAAPDEIPPGKGLLSGDDGEFVVNF